ncbi:hypothetical protein BC831DRAFT_473115 [Entophlyctis helioformis]|nr:hypothetical protein BC831DRAFT_473115 [Entophlyctis helioformis]
MWWMHRSTCMTWMMTVARIALLVALVACCSVVQSTCSGVERCLHPVHSVCVAVSRQAYHSSHTVHRGMPCLCMSHILVRCNGACWTIASSGSCPDNHKASKWL